jgi:NADH-quinone oxidoreductase subunit M
MFAFTVAGMDGSIYQILNESLAGAALFMLLGILYERYGTYDLRQYGGLAARLPWMVTMFVITGLAMVGLPMLNGFVGEFLILSGSMQSAFAHHLFWTTFGTLGVILSAAYVLTMIQRIFYGEFGPRPEKIAGWDLDVREHLAMWPMAALFLVMGVAPTVWLRAIDIAGSRLAGTTQSGSSTSAASSHWNGPNEITTQAANRGARN